jgi:type III pantothenate kinase
MPTKVAGHLTGRLLPRDQAVQGLAVASVVPALTRSLTASLRSYAGVSPLVVGANTRTGLRFRYDRSQLGADRVCVAVGAHREYGGNLIVLDLGTAFTVNVVTAGGTFLGGAIMPGLSLMALSLAAGTAALPPVPLKPVARPIQHDTAAAVRSGISALAFGGIASIIDRIEQQTGQKFRVVATGGFAPLMRRHVKRIRTVDRYLANRGLAELCYINRPALRRPSGTTQGSKLREEK